MIVQSLLFPKSAFSIHQAKQWLTDNGFKSSKVKVAKDFNFLSFEQYTIRYIKEKCNVNERIEIVNKQGIIKICYE